MPNHSLWPCSDSLAMKEELLSHRSPGQWTKCGAGVPPASFGGVPPPKTEELPGETPGQLAGEDARRGRLRYFVNGPAPQGKVCARSVAADVRRPEFGAKNASAALPWRPALRWVVSRRALADAVYWP